MESPKGFFCYPVRLFDWEPSFIRHILLKKICLEMNKIENVMMMLFSWFNILIRKQLSGKLSWFHTLKFGTETKISHFLIALKSKGLTWYQKPFEDVHLSRCKNLLKLTCHNLKIHNYHYTNPQWLKKNYFTLRCLVLSKEMFHNWHDK